MERQILSDRDIFTNIATLSGDLTQNDGANFANNGENALHVVTGSGTDMTARLDGFTITAGNANGVTPFDARGGGMFNFMGSPCISNCTFVSNAAKDGAGMANDDSSPAITNCSFLGNQATQGGGGMYNTDGSPTVTNCIFSGNVATGDPVPNAGGMYNNSGANPIITNSTFSGNSTSGNGGGIYNSAATSTLINTIIWNNQDQSGTGTANSSIDGDPSTFTYSLIQNITTNDANGNKDGITTAGDANYPDFVMPLAPGLNTGGDYRLQITSPAIDMGDDAAVPADSKDVDDDGDTAEPTPDLDLNNRIVGAMVDLGAYEFPCASEAGEIANADLTICQGDDPGTIFTASGAQNDAEYSFHPRKR
ncbi:MAG: hypothetical protein IPJ74_14820 [Saprospiraceae bacterium]|nr:hypothetical protein [Saprospiraceae bacterium]